MYILDIKNTEKIEVEVVPGQLKMMPLKKNGWNFNWRAKVKEEGTRTFVLRHKWNPDDIEGILQLRTYEGMLVMDLIEIAPRNIGTDTKKYDRVAGILIAFACRESFDLSNEYKGFLTFQSKTELVELYKRRYGARQALGQRMYFEPEVGIRLINEFLKK